MRLSSLNELQDIEDSLRFVSVIYATVLEL